MQATTIANDAPHARLFHTAIRIIIPLGVTSLALYLLSHLSGDIGLAAIQKDAATFPWRTLFFAFCASAISYLFLSLYDALILPIYSDVKIPAAVLMMTGASSLAVSNLFGFSWLTGGAIRFKVYTSYHIKITAIAKLMAASWVAFFSGLFALIGSVMMFTPAAFGAITHIPNSYIAICGLSILILLSAFFRWSWTTPRTVGLGAVRLALPKGRIGLKLTLVTVLDLIATALTLYILLPPDLTQDFLFFLGIFSIAVGLGILSHSPGGLGVFDATLIAGFGAMGRTDVLAAIAMYRVIYTVIPAGIALICITVAWLYTNRDIAQASACKIYTIVTPVIPLIAAGTAMTCGAILVIAGNLQPDPDRLILLRNILPLQLIETSHLIGSMSGVLLMIVASGLYRRMFRAWLVTMILAFIGLIVSILKGSDWEEATTLALGMLILWIFKSAFYRASLNTGPSLNIRWLLTVCALVGAIGWLGFFAQANIQHTGDLWWKFAWHGEASRFIRATLCITVVLAAFLLNALLSKETARLRHMPIPDAVIALTLAAKRATAGLALTGDKRFIITPDQKAYLAYADTGSALICKGDPIGEKPACIAAIWQLRELADKMGRRCAFYGVSGEYLPTFLDLGLQILKIGEVARVNLQDFNLDGPKRKDWRNAKARMAREGYHFEVLPAGQASADFHDLKSVSDAWLTHKNGQEKGFSLGWFDADYIAKFDLGVLRQTASGQIMAFANIMKAGDKSELFIDLMRYDPAGPNRVMDALFTELMLWGKENGYATFSLGGAPLSGLEQHPLACTWHKIGSFMYRNGEQFYKFDGLRRYKQKFDPDWTPEYLATTSKLDAIRVLYEVSLLISRGAPDLRKAKQPARNTSIATAVVTTQA